MAEPFSVALHATRRAGELLGKRVLITGCGPIGALAIVACQPTVRVEAPKDPIVINLNVKIEQEIRVKVEKDVEDLIGDEELF